MVSSEYAPKGETRERQSRRPPPQEPASPGTFTGQPPVNATKSGLRRGRNRQEQAVIRGSYHVDRPVRTTDVAEPDLPVTCAGCHLPIIHARDLTGRGMSTQLAWYHRACANTRDKELRGH